MAHKHILSFIAFLVLPNLCLSAASQTAEQICDMVSDICMSQIYDTNTNTSIGFAFPEAQQELTDNPFEGDYLVNLTTSFPYGFSGFTLAKEDGNVSTDAMNTYMTRLGWNMTELVHKRQIVAGTTDMVLVMQRSTYSSDGTYLLPKLNDSGKLTPSKLSWMDTTKGKSSFVFRCQNCTLPFPETFNEAAAPIMLMWSDADPIYITPMSINANLSLPGLTSTRLSYNVTAARTGNYTNLLRAAGLLDGQDLR